jgi:signal transduction histidine kinase
VARRRWLRGLTLGSPLRRRSVRFRMTVLYSCLFIPLGVILVAVTYVIATLRRAAAVGREFLKRCRQGRLNTGPVPPGARVPHKACSSDQIHATVNVASVSLSSREFLVVSCIILVALMGVTVLLGWIAAGRVLRPLRVMTSTTRDISERNLHERLALAGPDDELKDLGDTIDGLLARLEMAFDSQRRFIANASHELRTPLMLSQTLLQVALANPAITLDSLRAACQEVVDAGKDQAQLIDALLTLARSQRGLDQREPIDLTAIVTDVLNAHEPSAAARRLLLDAAIGDASVPGDARLIHRLVSNLVDNAIRYNMTGGRVEVRLAAAATDGLAAAATDGLAAAATDGLAAAGPDRLAATATVATLTVTNTGPPVPPDQVSRLLEPFQRAVPNRVASPNGLGLGLSIVADIAEAHGASLSVHPRPEGGLTVAVSFPADPA